MVTVWDIKLGENKPKGIISRNWRSHELNILVLLCMDLTFHIFIKYCLRRKVATAIKENPKNKTNKSIKLRYFSILQHGSSTWVSSFSVKRRSDSSCRHRIFVWWCALLPAVASDSVRMDGVSLGWVARAAGIILHSFSRLLHLFDSV